MADNNLLLFCLVLLLLTLSINTESINDKQPVPKLRIYTVATEETDGLERLLRSAQVYDLSVNVLGMGEQWNGGDTRYEAGGGQKIRLLHDALVEYRNDDDSMVLFIDAYDVIFNADAETILNRFFEHYSTFRVVFSAEQYCWPNKQLAVQYPLVKFGKRYLNSGMFIGYTSEIYKILTLKSVNDADDDQLYYTNIYINEKYRNEFRMTLDSMSFIFQNLNGAIDDVEIEFDTNSGNALAHNAAYNTHPVIVHGNGASKVYLNHLGNYLGEFWSKDAQCRICANIKSTNEVDDQLMLSIFITKPIPFLDEFFQKLIAINYRTDRMHLFVYSNQKFAEKTVNEFLEKVKNTYLSQNVIHLNMEIGERDARKLSIEHAIQLDVNYLFSIDGDVQLTNANTIIDLINALKTLKASIIAPLVGRPGKMFTNYWGALSSTGYYQRSDDYLEIVNGNRIGVWNIPFVTGAYLLAKKRFAIIKNAYTYNMEIDADMSFCQFARDHGIFMFVDNRHEYGFLVDADNFKLNDRLHPEMYQIFDNRYLWESRYLHPDYRHILDKDSVIEQPCPDAYDFPLMSERFCRELIEEMENYGQWSAGKNQDNRLAGGYENVPTRDIHMKQIDFERHWLYFLDEYVRPVQEKVFIGYYFQPIESNMMFVVRYKPDEQASLRPHHDASTYSIDVALNRYGVDYDGGGVRFLRYNCTLPTDRVGWSMIFPGRLTHMHEGLPTTRGVRYIAVSFINP